MKDIASSLPGIDEILRTLQSHRGSATNHDLLPGIALFGAGVLLGAGLALLFAPSSGSELRENLSERIDEVRERINGATGEEVRS
jgi:hypothetical protein